MSPLDLSKIGLSPEQLIDRRRFVGCSDANIIALGKSAEVNRLALVKRGLADPDDLSGVLRVMLGTYTEPFNLAWAERELGYALVDRGKQIVSDRHPWLRASLDAWDPVVGAPVNAKHTNERATGEEIVQRYLPQCHAEMIVTGARVAILTVIYGNARYSILRVPYDALYAGQLIDLLGSFWAAVQEGRDPLPVTVEPPPEPYERLVEVDLTGNNAFADAAERWRTNRAAAALFEAADKDLKSMIPGNARRAFGHGVEVVRSTNGARRVKECV